MAFTRTSTTAKAAMLNALVTAAGASATIKLYTGSAPANVNTAATGTLLATLTCGSVIGTVSGATLTLASITGVNAVASGAWGYARLSTSGGTALMDLDVGTSGTSIIMTQAYASSGVGLTVSSGTITMG